MKKRAQIAVFIILIVIVLSLIGIFFLINSFTERVFVPDVEKVKLFTENCIYQEGAEIIYRVGENSGYYFPTDYSTDGGVAYYYDGKGHAPSKEDIENEISFYLKRKLIFCTKNFIDFPDLNISQREIEVDTVINDDEVILNVKYPLSIRKGESSITIENFNVDFPVRLGILHDSALEVLDEQIKGTEKGVCLNCLLDVALRNNFYVDLLDYDDNTVIFVFRDESTIVEERGFRFIFANKYETKGAVG